MSRLSPRRLLALTAIACALSAPLWLSPSVQAQNNPAPQANAELAEVDRLVAQGVFQQALDRVNNYLANRPKDPQGRFLKGVILAELQKPSDAIQVFTGLTEDYPELPEPYNNLAVLYASQGQFDKARVALELAIHTHPSYATAHENLGDIYAKLASRAYDRALQLDRSNSAAQAKLSMIRDLFTGKGPRPVAIAKTDTKPMPAPRPAPAPAAPVAAPKPPAASPTTPAPPAANGTVPAQAPKPLPPVAAAPPKAMPEPPAAPPAPAAAAPKSVATEDSGAEIVQAVRSWARAWSDKDVDGYLAFYAPEFATPDGSSRGAWETARRQRIRKPGPIQVALSDINVSMSGADSATVTFRQAYRSANLSSTNGKTLRMVRSGGRWLIQEERVRGQ